MQRGKCGGGAGDSKEGRQIGSLLGETAACMFVDDRLL